MFDSPEKALKGNATLAISPRERLILALDVPAADDAKRLVESLDDRVVFYKVGLELFTATGFGVIDWLVSQGKKVFLDIKWLDIPETVGAVVRIASERNTHFATVDGNGDSEMLRGAVRERKNELKLLCLTVLTSLSDHALQEMGKGITVADMVRRRANMAIDAGMDGVITSGHEVKICRDAANAKKKGGFLVVTPGMRLPGASSDDHQRAADPEAAIRDGADYIVVGRPIRQADDRRAAAEKFVDAIKRGLAARSPGSPATV